MRAPTVKQHLAAVRMLFDWLVTGQVIRSQPGHVPCAAPSTSSARARRPVLTPEETRLLLDAHPRPGRWPAGATGR